VLRTLNRMHEVIAGASVHGSVLLDGVANSGVHVFGADCAFEVSATNGA